MIVKKFVSSSPPNIAVIGLHGYTGDENSLQPVTLGIHAKSTKWFFPRGPYKSVKKDGYSWFKDNDQKSWDFQDAFTQMNALFLQIKNEGFPEKNIYVLGFSQGACLAMEYMIRLPFSIGGIIPIAGFIHSSNQFEKQATNGSKGTPVFLFHGLNDNIVPYHESEKAHQLFTTLGYNSNLMTYRAKHKIPVTVLQNIKHIIETT